MLMDGKLQVDDFRRIQVNGRVEAAEAEMLCALYPRHIILTQHHLGSAHLLDVPSKNHALLIDASGGRGESPETWIQPITEKAVGFAGGLGPANLASELQTIREISRAGWWVDMEGKLRVEDWFSVERAQECAAIFAAANLPPSPATRT